jgi:hypothetical protein
MAYNDDPMLMDALGNPTIPDVDSLENMLAAYKKLQAYNRGQDTTSEEESKPVTQTTKIDPKTGEETVTISGSKRDLSAANPMTPTVTPSAYDQYIGQQESSNNPNIGYHNPAKSSAFGQFGITAPAYADIQAADPRFAGRDITSLSPAEQSEANKVLRAQYEQQLQAKGVEPSEGNVRLAHLLGAGGAHQYLTQGTFNPEAVAANGGEAKLKQIADARLASAQPQNPLARAASTVLNAIVPSAQAAEVPRGPGPDYSVNSPGAVNNRDAYRSAPATPVAPGQTTADVAARPGTTLAQDLQPMGPSTASMDQEGWAQRFATAQQDPKMVAEMAFDPNAPKWVRTTAEQHLGSFIAQKRAEGAAQDLLTKAQETGDFRQVGREMQRPVEDGSWLKYILFKHMGLGEASQLEANKLGLLDKVITARGPNGEYGLLTVDGRGMPKSGITQDNKAIPQEDLNAWASAGAEQAAVLKVAQTQATNAYTQMYTNLAKKRAEFVSGGATERDLAERGLDMASIKRTANQAGAEVLNAAKSRYRVETTQPATQASTGANPLASLVSGAQTPGIVAPNPTGEFADSKILSNWQSFRPGEDAKAKLKRTSVDPSEIDSVADSLVAGNIKPNELTGRGNAFRSYAIERALEKDPTYTPMRYQITQDVIKRYTSGKDHETLVNIGTAGNHLIQFKDAAGALPEGMRSDVSAWNSFAQKYSKFANAPEVKNKETMAEFVAGEAIKAATGGHGGVAERLGLEKKLLNANTPAEWNAVIDGQMKLAHGRYDSMKKSYEASTKRKDFNSLIGMPDEVADAFVKIEGMEAAKKGKFKDAKEEAAYQEWKRKQEKK